MRLSVFISVLAVLLAPLVTGIALANEQVEPIAVSTPEADPQIAEPAGQDDPEAVRLVAGTEPANATSAVVGAVATSTDAQEAQPSATERIARLEASVRSDEQRLEQLKAMLDSPESEYVRSETRFRELDDQRNELLQKLADVEKAERAEELARLQVDAEELEKKWHLAKERFDLAVGERMSMQESVLTLQRKLESDRDTLLKLRDSQAPQRLSASVAGSPQPAQLAPQPETMPAVPAAPPSAAATPPSVAREAATAPVAIAPSPSADPKSADVAPPAVEKVPILAKTIVKELAVAHEVAQKSHVAAQAAEAEARTITERMEILREDIGQQRKMRDNARKTVDNSEKSLQGLNEELFRKLMANENIDDVHQQIDEASQRLKENRAKSREISTRLDELQSQLTHLQAEQLAAASNLTDKRNVAERAQAIVESLKNPFTARNLMQWLIDHGPRIATILMALALFMWLSRICERRLVELTAKRGRRGSREERENRAKTLLGVFHNVANIAIVTGGMMMILDEVGIPAAPIVGSAAVLGLAVAFGAQTLIKDYFVGFMVLLEQQYLVNDVIEIGAIKGQVERISLRITVLRDLEGRVHFIPHSQINTVTNLTHGWSRAVFEIGVAYKENVDHVIQVLSTLANELRSDDAFKLFMLSDPVMLGVDSFGSSAVVIKFYIQTRPLQQWTVKREMLRRIKNEFDRQGIEIPFPHMTVYHGTPKAEEQTDQGSSSQWPKRQAA